MGILIPLVSMLVILAASSLYAQETAPAPHARVIEEIVVTAQKRSEDVREVRVSMSVFDESFIRQEGITDYRDVSLYSPSTKIDVNSLFPDIRMRGFGSFGPGKFVQTLDPPRLVFGWARYSF